MTNPERLPQFRAYLETLRGRKDKNHRLEDAKAHFGDLDRLDQELRQAAIKLQRAALTNRGVAGERSFTNMSNRNQKRNRGRRGRARMEFRGHVADEPDDRAPAVGRGARGAGAPGLPSGPDEGPARKGPDRGGFVHDDRRRWAGSSRSDREAGAIPGRDEPGEVARQESAGRGRWSGPTAPLRSIRLNSKPWSWPSI